MSAILRGIFPVLQTAVNDDDGLDVVSLRKQVDFCIQAGAHGLVVDAIFPRAYPDSFFDLAASLPELTIVIAHVAQVPSMAATPTPHGSKTCSTPPSSRTSP